MTQDDTMRASSKSPPTSDWLGAIRIYFAALVSAHLVWEVLQLPLYTIWKSHKPGELAFAVIHCTGGDALIGLSCFLGALFVAGQSGWPQDRFDRVAVIAIVAGVAYTGFSEWLNVSVRRSWAYSEWMPIMSVAGVRIGLSPILQWLVIPAGAFAMIRPRVKAGPQPARD